MPKYITRIIFAIIKLHARFQSECTIENEQERAISQRAAGLFFGKGINRFLRGNRYFLGGYDAEGWLTAPNQLDFMFGSVLVLRVSIVILPIG